MLGIFIQQPTWEELALYDVAIKGFHDVFVRAASMAAWI